MYAIRSYYDELDHASIIEGRRLSFSQAFKYKHNDMASLEKVLKQCAPDKIVITSYSIHYTKLYEFVS